MSNSTYLEPDDFSLQRSKEFRERMQKEQEKETERYYQKKLIDKACEWLSYHIMEYSWYDPFTDNSGYDGGAMLNDFRKAMEE